MPKMLLLQSTIQKKTTTYNIIQPFQQEERRLLMHLHKSLSKMVSIHKYREFMQMAITFSCIHSHQWATQAMRLSKASIYRVNENGKIAEHWDVIQQIPNGPANNNTMFYLDQILQIPLLCIDFISIVLGKVCFESGKYGFY